MMPKIELVRAQIHLTNKCNLKCKYCEVPIKFAQTKDLLDKKWLEIMNDLVDLKVKDLTISGGGEPTLRFDLLIKILSITFENKIKTGIITNGTQVNRERAKKIVEVQPTEWRTSICSPVKNVDAVLRGKDMSKKSFEGIKYISEWKKKLNSELPKLEIWMLQTKYNIEHIPRMIRKAHEIGANSISIRMVNPPSSALYPTARQREKLVKSMESYKKMAENFGLEIKFHFQPFDIFSPRSKKLEKKKNEKRNIFCLFPFHEIVIFADGRVSPCCNYITFPKNYELMENIENKSLESIWFGKIFEKFRKKMIRGNLPEACKNCTPDFKSVDREYREIYGIYA